MTDLTKVERNVLFHFLDDLIAHWSNIQNKTSCHLGLLLDYMKVAYKPTKAHLTKLLKYQEISYDLLWALFPPNALVYTCCRGTKKPQCVRYDFGHEKKLENGTVYFSLKCRYLDYDGNIFGDVSTEFAILKFRGTESIPNLSCFPVRYYPDRSTHNHGSPAELRPEVRLSPGATSSTLRRDRLFHGRRQAVSSVGGQSCHD